MSVESEAEPGLRERKRLATRRAILAAAAELVEERGLEGATIEEISRRAEVSARTFFNYFPSKEAALAGDAPVAPDEATRMRFLAGGGTLFADLVELLVACAADERLDDREYVRRRVQLTKQVPEVMVLRMGSMRDFEAGLAALVAERIAVDPDAAGVLPADAERAARMLVGATMAALRTAWFEWANDDGARELGDYVREDCATLERVLLAALGR